MGLAREDRQEQAQVRQSVQQMEQMIETGEVPVAIFHNDNLVGRVPRDGAKPVQIVFPKEGLPTEPGGMGFMKNAAHPHAGRLLIDWWLGDEGQKANVAGYKYSPRPDMAPPNLCPPLKELKLWEQGCGVSRKEHDRSRR